MTSRIIDLPSPDATCSVARLIGDALVPGDVLLLSGGIGAGKTHFARCLIHALQDSPEDVPSPTFTIVQIYETRAGELWHADLYRLGNADECVELGLTDAFDAAICIVEWPDRLEELVPQKALSLTFADGPTDDARKVELSWSDSRWNDLVPALAA